jgi:hypothetical protein
MDDGKTTINQVVPGWWFQPLLKKNISQLGSLFPIYGKNVPNHQPGSH